MRTVVKKMYQRMKIWRTYVVQTVRSSVSCVENVCMRAKIKDTSYQALNLANQIRLLGDAPNQCRQLKPTLPYIILYHKFTRI